MLIATKNFEVFGFDKMEHQKVKLKKSDLHSWKKKFELNVQ